MDEIYERERWEQSLFTLPNKYGYQLNVNNPVIKACRENIFPPGYRPESDSERITFENAFWKFLLKYFRKYDPKTAKLIPKKLDSERHMSEILSGWKLELLEIFVNSKLDIEKTVELFGKENNLNEKG